MTGKIIPLGNITYLNTPPDQILDGALGKLESVIIIGYTKAGDEYFASSISDGGTVLWVLERMKKALLNVVDADL